MSTRYSMFRLVQWLSARLPAATALACADRCADVWVRCAANTRAVVSANLEMALGSAAPQASQLREVFRNFGRYLVEFFSMHRTPHSEVALEGLHHLKQARQPNRGAIVLTAHLGNWELGAAVLRRLGMPVTVVALSHGDPGLDRLFNQQRQRCDVGVIPLGRDAAVSGLQRLREGDLLGLIGDREFAQHGIEMPMFNRPLTLPSGPAFLSLRSQAPVVPTFLIREGRGRFRLCCEPPIWPDAHDVQDASIRRMTQRYAAVLERYISRFPEQWLMFQPLTEPG